MSFRLVRDLYHSSSLEKALLLPCPRFHDHNLIDEKYVVLRFQLKPSDHVFTRGMRHRKQVRRVFAMPAITGG